MKNANFGYVCRSNANNIKFQSVIDEVNEISYIKNILTFLIIGFHNL